MLSLGRLVEAITAPFRAAVEAATGQDILIFLKQTASAAWRSLAMGPGVDGSVESAQAANKPKSYIDSNGRYQG